MKSIFRKVAAMHHFRFPLCLGPLLGLYTKFFSEIYNFIYKQMQYIPINDIRNINEQQIISIVNRVRETVPFYRKRLKNIKTLADFSNLAVVTKEDMRRAFEGGSVINRGLINYAIKQRTSGSTGIPFYFLLDKNMQARRLAYYRYVLESIGRLSGDIVLVLMPDQHLMLETEYTFLKCQRPEDIDQEYENIKKVISNRLTIIQSRTSYLIRLAQLLEKSNTKVSCKAMIAVSEELSREVRDYLERIFNAPAFSYYGCNEVTAVGVECEAHSGVHVNIGHTYTEVVDESGRPVANGGSGDIIVTSLDNEVMPFIRYQTGDRGSWIEGPCLCGRTSPRVVVDGRKVGLIHLPNGEIKYSGEISRLITLQISKVYRYQIIRQSFLEFEIRIVPLEHFGEGDLNNLKKEIEKYLGLSVAVVISVIENIPVLPGAKLQPFVDLTLN